MCTTRRRGRASRSCGATSSVVTSGRGSRRSGTFPGATGGGPNPPRLRAVQRAEGSPGVLAGRPRRRSPSAPAPPGARPGASGRLLDGRERRPRLRHRAPGDDQEPDHGGSGRGLRAPRAVPREPGGHGRGTRPRGHRLAGPELRDDRGARLLPGQGSPRLRRVPAPVGRARRARVRPPGARGDVEAPHGPRAPGGALRALRADAHRGGRPGRALRGAVAHDARADPARRPGRLPGVRAHAEHRGAGPLQPARRGVSLLRRARALGGMERMMSATTPPPGAPDSAERQIARVSLAAERDYLSAVLALLREATSRLGLPAADVSDLERAVEEVCLNVVVHGFEPGQAASFDVALLRRPGHVVVAVEDRGLPYDFADLAAPQARDLPAPSLTRLAHA